MTARDRYCSIRHLETEIGSAWLVWQGWREVGVTVIMYVPGG